VLGEVFVLSVSLHRQHPASSFSLIPKARELSYLFAIRNIICT